MSCSRLGDLNQISVAQEGSLHFQVLIKIWPNAPNPSDAEGADRRTVGALTQYCSLVQDRATDALLTSHFMFLLIIWISLWGWIKYFLSPFIAHSYSVFVLHHKFIWCSPLCFWCFSLFCFFCWMLMFSVFQESQGYVWRTFGFLFFFCNVFAPRCYHIYEWTKAW